VPVTFVGNHVLRDAIEPGVVHDAGVVALDHLAEEKRVGTDSSDPVVSSRRNGRGIA
jgi:hypothetical protein